MNMFKNRLIVECKPWANSRLYVNAFVMPLKDNVPVDLKLINYLPSGRTSRTYSARYIKKPLKSPLPVKESKPGISFKFTDKKVSAAKNLQIDLPDTTGTMQAISLSPFASKITLGIIYEGYILVPADDMYKFTLKSDDGGVLYVADELIVVNDGEHASTQRAGTIPLRAGYHKIRLHYFDAGGGRDLQLRGSRNNGSFDLGNSLYH